MNKQRWTKIESLVDGALSYPESLQKTYIRQSCNSNPEIRQEALDLLMAIKESEGWMEQFYPFKKMFLR
ncbi:hypothetical protein [Gracilimonas mengyeensis]|uniref:Uncharacterized protein n=1 Tax=Gracilimonas mengyeensis TaxID=1302730 RepID=A0A521FLI6_9BACT|nr:hypothetical protein [Gracilimonas mengyeensis]SMO97067.1 hypothetical protein SAMN06265219_12233 [Gracilimonas mengyeensis]